MSANSLKLFWQASMLKTLLLNARLRAWHFPVIVFPRVQYGLGPGASLVGHGRLLFGRRWPLGRYYPSSFKIAAQAKVAVSGPMSIYTDASVNVNRGAFLELGSGYINEGVVLDCFAHISIGNDVAISKNVTIRDDHNHRLEPMSETSGPVRIGNRVWMGVNVTVLPGVTIGDGAVIAAGAVVIDDIPAGCLAAGVPARVKKTGVSWQ